MDDKVTLTAGYFSINDPDPAAARISFHVASGPILTITPDGQLVRGEGFVGDDEASVAFFDCLSRHLPGFLADLRQRAERAEAELKALKESRRDMPPAGHDPMIDGPWR